jgi:hypothetical protein
MTIFSNLNNMQLAAVGVNNQPVTTGAIDNSTLIGREEVSRRRTLAMGRKAIQKKALMAWASSLKDIDYNVTHWAESVAHVKGGPPQYFDNYLQKLSKLFLHHGAAVNFISIGACDGTNDLTIQGRYLKYPHWRGLFVEPMSINFADLEKLLRDNGAMERSFPLRAAATDICPSPTIKVQRPLFEEKNPSTPHWLRRQIGGIIAAGKGVRPEWTMEEVKCGKSMLLIICYL